jgi:hypothetical protein
VTEVFNVFNGMADGCSVFFFILLGLAVVYVILATIGAIASKNQPLIPPEVQKRFDEAMASSDLELLAKVSGELADDIRIEASDPDRQNDPNSRTRIEEYSRLLGQLQAHQRDVLARAPKN